jgi:hypothetical protein
MFKLKNYSNMKIVHTKKLYKLENYWNLKYLNLEIIWMKKFQTKNIKFLELSYFKKIQNFQSKI